jgi:uncharacterized membrane protein
MEAFWGALLWLLAAGVLIWIVGRAVGFGRAWRDREFTGSAPPMSPDELDLRRARGEISEEEYQREKRQGGRW